MSVGWRKQRSGSAARSLNALPLTTLARCVSLVSALSLADPSLAGSDPPDIANGTGDDPTQPLGKIELLDRYTEAPGPGVEEETAKRVETSTPFVRIEAAVQARATMGTELPNGNSGRVDKWCDPGESDRRNRLRLWQRAHPGLARPRLRSALGRRGRRAVDRAELDQRRGDERLGAGYRFRHPRHAPGDQSGAARSLNALPLTTLARCVSLVSALSLADPSLAGSDPPDIANGTGDDPTQPLGKIELLDRYTEAPGPGVEEGTTKRVETSTPFVRIEAPFKLAPQWELNFRTEIPVVWTNGVTPENPTGATVSGFGNVLTQAWLVHDFDQRWAVAVGGQLIAPSSTNGVATNAWEQVTGFVIRAMLPEISPGSYFAPQVRYGIDFEGNDDGKMLRQLRIAPTLNINLPHDLFFTLYSSPDIRLNYGTPVWNQTGRLFVPLNFLIGWKPTKHVVVSAEFGIPIIRDFPVYTFKTQLRVGYLF